MTKDNFSFRSDQLRKAVKLPWFVVLALISKAMPRDNSLWLFSRRTGFGDGPLAIYKELKSRDPSARSVWLYRSEKDRDLAVAAGIKCVDHSSFLALWLCLRAGYGVMTNGFSDLRGPAIWGAKTIQLWHGAPLKKIGLDRKYGRKDILTFASGFFEKIWNNNYHIVVSGSDVTSSRLSSAMGVPDKLVVTGDPRMDLVNKYSNAKELIAKFAGLSDCHTKKFILVAPTWRDNGGDVGVDVDIDILNEKISSDTYIFVRAHPHSKEISSLMAFKNSFAISSEDFPDITSLLSGFDALLTDYSSIAMDFSVLNRPILFCAPDLDNYSKDPGLYEDYSLFTGGAYYRSWNKLFEELEISISPSSGEYKKHCDLAKAIASKYHPYGCEGNSRRVLDCVLSG